MLRKGCHILNGWLKHPSDGTSPLPLQGSKELTFEAFAFTALSPRGRPNLLQTFGRRGGHPMPPPFPDVFVFVFSQFFFPVERPEVFCFSRLRVGRFCLPKLSRGHLRPLDILGNGHIETPDPYTLRQGRRISAGIHLVPF